MSMNATEALVSTTNIIVNLSSLERVLNAIFSISSTLVLN